MFTNMDKLQGISCKINLLMAMCLFYGDFSLNNVFRGHNNKKMAPTE